MQRRQKFQKSRVTATYMSRAAMGYGTGVSATPYIDRFRTTLHRSTWYVGFKFNCILQFGTT